MQMFDRFISSTALLLPIVDIQNNLQCMKRLVLSIVRLFCNEMHKRLVLCIETSLFMHKTRLLMCTKTNRFMHENVSF